MRRISTDSDGKGLGIALVAAMKAKVPVTIVDNSQASIDKGLKFASTPLHAFSLQYMPLI